jgi:DNA-binding HxlR family transcriptional regulator
MFYLAQLSQGGTVGRSNFSGGRHPLESSRNDRFAQAEREHAPATTNLDRLIHERMRLGIVSALAANESLSFNDLKKLLATTDGNLSVHARKLEEAKYIVCEKYFEGRLPKTVYRLSPAGRRALEIYLNQMEALIHSMRAH